MKRYSAPLGRMNELKHEHPERTAYRHGVGIFADVFFQVWPNRESMLTTIRMQEKRAPHSTDWKPLVKD